MNIFSSLGAFVTLLILVCSLPVEVSAEGEAQAGLPPPREIAGITAPDQFPRGCVDCHINRPDLQMDVRISTLITQWQDRVDPAFVSRLRPFVPEGMTLSGRHPPFKAEVANIPEDCLMCHEQASQIVPPLGRLLHGLHLVGGENNHFLSMFQGQCTHCHKLNSETGVWSLGGGREQGP